MSKAPKIGYDVESPSSSKSGIMWWVIAASIIVLAAVTAVLVARSDTASSDLVEGKVVASGSVLPTFSPDLAFDDPAVGMAAPRIQGQTFDGTDISFVSGDGDPKVLIFLAHWCTICQKEVPTIVEWHEQNPDALNGVEIISVSTGVDRVRGNYPPGEWLRGERWPFPVIVDSADSQAGSVYGVPGYPYFVAVDGSGNVVARTVGDISMEGFAELINAARTGESVVVVPESAKQQR